MRMLAGSLFPQATMSLGALYSIDARYLSEECHVRSLNTRIIVMSDDGLYN